MKKMMLIAVMISVFIIILPVTLAGKNNYNREKEQTLVSEVGTKTLVKEKDLFRVFDKKSNTIILMTAQDYIFGVIAAEMPALYHTEALKAQAVAAYTYACYKRDQNANKKYDITTDYTVDQSYKEKAQAKKDWGSKGDEYTKKIESVIEATTGQILTYNNKPILAVYHAVSSGRTYSAKDVWGTEIKYLQSASCEGDKLANNYICEFEFTTAQLKKKFSIDKNEEKMKLISNCKTKSGGLVESASVFGNKFSGSEIRNVLNLPSQNFTVTLNKNGCIITTYGYGHGVGMSQNGANYMANQGYSYKKILSHFYRNSKLVEG